MLHLLCLGVSASLFPKSTPRIGALELHPSNITEYVLHDQTPKTPLIAWSLLLESLKERRLCQPFTYFYHFARISEIFINVECTKYKNPLNRFEPFVAYFYFSVNEGI